MFNRTLTLWNKQDRLSKWIIIILITTLFISYLPTLYLDYVPEDQWRAFRYSTTAETPSYRASACLNMIPEFYTLTGRPLVWITECMEHAFVSKISDFSYLRPLAFLAMLITVAYLGATLSSIIGNLLIALIASTMLVMEPGYAFMYLQSMPALMVLLSIILSTASFNYLDKALTQVRCGYVITAFLLFFIACCIYPIWAFIVIPLIALSLLFNEKITLLKKFKRSLLAVAFYFISTLIYYLFVKISISIVIYLTGNNIPLNQYEVSMQLSPTLIFQRIHQLFSYGYAIPSINDYLPKGICYILIALSSIHCVAVTSEIGKRKFAYFIGLSTAIMLLILSMLLASSSPWLFSKMDTFKTRHSISWYLFCNTAGVTLIYRYTKNFFKVPAKFVAILLLIFILTPLTIKRYQLSILEIKSYETEIGLLRNYLFTWIEKAEWDKKRHVVIVLPTQKRIAFIENKFINNQQIGDLAKLSSAENPVSIPWMVNAILREHNNHPIGKKIQIADCGFNYQCAENIYSDTSKIALNYTYGDLPVISKTTPYIINLSTITTQPVYPMIQHAK